MQDFMAMENKAPQIAILSGKGGTGKTLLAVNLAAVSGPSVYVDCDVEEPNGHLFFKPDILEDTSIQVKIPVLDEAHCTGCRICVDFCKFNALAFIKEKPYVFPEVCHSCEGCMLLCPEDALGATDKEIGRIQKGLSDTVTVYTGILNTGEASGTPIISTLLEKIRAEAHLPTFIDCPPGSACIVMDSIQDADYCVLVAEPTVFGAHNLSMVYELVTLFNRPHGVVLNKTLPGRNPAEDFCLAHDIPIIGRIPFDPELGTRNANARIVARSQGPHRDIFVNLLDTVMKEVHHETIAHS